MRGGRKIGSKGEERGGKREGWRTSSRHATFHVLVTVVVGGVLQRPQTRHALTVLLCGLHQSHALASPLPLPPTAHTRGTPHTSRNSSLL